MLAEANKGVKVDSHSLTHSKSNVQPKRNETIPPMNKMPKRGNNDKMLWMSVTVVKNEAIAPVLRRRVASLGSRFRRVCRHVLHNPSGENAQVETPLRRRVSVER